MAKHHERTDARKQAVQILYTCEIQNKNPHVLLDAGCCLIGDFPENDQDEQIAMKAPVLLDYALVLVSGVEQYRDSLDHELESTSENWAVSRMPIVDRCILRLSTYEMLYVDDVPISVSINEAVELAKDFGGEDDSPRFVNGVLGCIAKRIEARKEEATVADNAECETDV